MLITNIRVSVKPKLNYEKIVWWLGLSADTENYIKSCYACQVTNVQCGPLKMTEIPKTWPRSISMRNKPSYPVFTSMKTVNSVNIIKSLQKHFHSLAIQQKSLLTMDHNLSPVTLKHIYQHTTKNIAWSHHTGPLPVVK